MKVGALQAVSREAYFTVVDGKISTLKIYKLIETLYFDYESRGRI